MEAIPPSRIAIIGGTDFDSRELDRFLLALKEKYPRAIIVTGDGKGAEKHAAESARMLGFTVEIPPLHPEWFQKPMDCQVNDVLIGADVIVLAGPGGRVKLATDWWHRMNMHQRDERKALVKVKGEYVSRREPWNRLPLHALTGKTSSSSKDVAKAA